MKLKEINIPVEPVITLLYFLWFIVAINALMLGLTIVKALALWIFDYKIIIFGIPL